MLRTRFAVHEQDGDAVMSSSSMQNILRYPANARGICPEIRLKHGEAWTASAAALFPHVHGSPDIWVTVAQREPKLLLSMV